MITLRYATFFRRRGGDDGEKEETKKPHSSHTKKIANKNDVFGFFLFRKLDEEAHAGEKKSRQPSFFFRSNIDASH